VFVGNTDGEGVYVRNTPAMSDRVRAYPDGTPLEIVGPDTEGEGMSWHHVRAPDGVEGYVPVQYTVVAGPEATPTPAP
jgi:Bacterial SH3 domain